MEGLCRRYVLGEDGVALVMGGGWRVCRCLYKILGYASWILASSRFSYSSLWAVDTTLVLCYTTVFVSRVPIGLVGVEASVEHARPDAKTRSVFSPHIVARMVGSVQLCIDG